MTRRRSPRFQRLHSSERGTHMTDYTGFKEIGVMTDGLVATVEIRRPPNNFFDAALIAEISQAFERIDADPAIRTIVLAAEGRHFCAGADFSKRMDTGTVIRKRSGCSARRSLLSVRFTGRRLAAGSASRWFPISA